MTTAELFIDSDEVAKLLRLNKKTIYSYVHYKQIPSHLYRKLGTRILFIKENVIEWVINGAKLEKRNCRTR